MIILFANKYPVDQAVSHYIETKIWKHSRPKHPRKNDDIVIYLETKIEKFLTHLADAEKRVARNLFEQCIHQIKKNQVISHPTPNVFNLKVLEESLSEELKSCFKDLNHASTSQVDGFRQDVWENGDDWVDARWKLTQKSGSPLVEIDSLRAKDKGGKGRATNFLTAIIRVLQLTQDPYAEIRLTAWTGMNFYYGFANGGYVWARLGIEFCDSKSYRYNRALESHRYDYIKRAFTKILQTDSILFQLYDFLNKKHDLCELRKIADECISLLDNLHTPWEFANLVVQGHQLGKFLMTFCDSARYSGIMFPNQLHSPGMIQYNKRMSQLRECYSDLFIK